MKKVKLLFIIPALSLAVGGALATKVKDQTCTGTNMYYFAGGVYYPVGQSGITYICSFNQAYTCTYYKPNPVTQPNVYAPCLAGIYTPIIPPPPNP